MDSRILLILKVPLAELEADKDHLLVHSLMLCRPLSLEHQQKKKKEMPKREI